MDTVNRTQKVSKTPGKRPQRESCLKTTRFSSVATGLLGGHIGAFIKEKLDEVGLAKQLLSYQSETRNCIAIPHEGLQTEIPRGRSYHYTRGTSGVPSLILKPY